MVVKDKVAVITGGASGIGRETARRYATHGASVVVADVDTEGGAETADLITDDGGDAVFVETDVTNPESVQSMIETAVDEYGGLDVLFNNAGIEGKLAELDDEAIEPIIDVNLKGVLYGMKYGIDAMLASGGGSIVNTSSVGGATGITGRSMYCAAKAFVTLASGRDGSSALREELQEYIKARLAPYEYPREIEFTRELPTTPVSGKIQRDDLRKREGIADGD